MKDFICILIVDNHTVRRKGLSSLLHAKPAIAVIGEATNGLEAFFMAREAYPDVLLMDYGIFQEDGAGSVLRIQREQADIAVLVLYNANQPVAPTAGSNHQNVWFSPRDMPLDGLEQKIREILAVQMTPKSD